MSNYASRADLQVAQPIIEFAEQTAERHGFDPDPNLPGAA